MSFRFQLSTFNFQLSTLNFQLPAVPGADRTLWFFPLGGGKGEQSISIPLIRGIRSCRNGKPPEPEVPARRLERLLYLTGDGGGRRGEIVIADQDRILGQIVTGGIPYLPGTGKVDGNRIGDSVQEVRRFLR